MFLSIKILKIGCRCCVCVSLYSDQNPCLCQTTDPGSTKEPELEDLPPPPPPKEKKEVTAKKVEIDKEPVDKPEKVNAIKRQRRTKNEGGGGGGLVGNEEDQVKVNSKVTAVVGEIKLQTRPTWNFPTFLIFFHLQNKTWIFFIPPQNKKQMTLIMSIENTKQSLFPTWSFSTCYTKQTIFYVFLS